MDSMQHAPQRRAALALHAVGEADRDWLLGSLPAGQQAALRLLLDELKSIGIPHDERVLDELCAASDVPAAPDPGRILLDRGAEQPEVLAALARSEPPAIVAGLCCAGGVQWREQLLLSLAPELRVQAEAQLPRLNGAPALRAAVIASVCRQLTTARPILAVRAKRWQGLASLLQMVRRHA
jgi:hypothetical protein